MPAAKHIHENKLLLCHKTYDVVPLEGVRVLYLWKEGKEARPSPQTYRRRNVIQHTNPHINSLVKLQEMSGLMHVLFAIFFLFRKIVLKLFEFL